MKKQITFSSPVTGIKHVIKNIGKTTAVINYAKWGSGLLIRNQPIGVGRTVTIQYQNGTFYSASLTQLQTVEKTTISENTKSIVNNKVEETIPNSINHIENKPLSIESESKIIPEMTTKNQEKNSRVIYTAIIGDYDNLKEPLLYDDTWDYICFTDSDKISTNTIWEIKPIPDIIQNLDSTRKSRALKILPHIFLESYQESIWVDGTIEILSSPTDLLNEYLDSDYDIMVCKHPDRICVYEESIACKKLKKDTRVIINKQIGQYRSEGYPEKWGMVQTMIMYRKNNENVRKHGDLWWSQVLSFSKRDQLSFNYSLWKENLKVKILPPSIISSEFFSFYKHQSNKLKKITLRPSYDRIQNYINGNSI